MNYDTGARLAVITSSKETMCGVSLGADGNTVSVALDNGKHQNLSKGLLYPVIYWKPLRRLVSLSRVNYKFPKVNWIDIFKSKNVVEYDWPLPLCMVLWANKHVFNGELNVPEISFRAGGLRSKFAGMFVYNANSDGTLILNKARLLSYSQLFSTVLHEMVHQYNFNIDYRRDHKFIPSAINVHGSMFTKWIPIIEGKTGVKITRFHAMENQEIDVEIPSEPENTKPDTKKKTYYVILKTISKTGKQFYLAAKTLDPEEARDGIRNIVGIAGASNLTVLEVSNMSLLRLIPEITKKVRGSVPFNDSYLFVINESIRNAIEKAGTPANLR